MLGRLGDRAQLIEPLIASLPQTGEEGGERRDQEERDDLVGVIEVGEVGAHDSYQRLCKYGNRTDESSHAETGERGRHGRRRDEERTEVDLRRHQDVDGGHQANQTERHGQQCLRVRSVLVQ
ncbi:hypothetical protein ACFU8W_33985 [Streptomyces sp. NPDC057565]|uniref:hypothetical protein n=1 Tax=Streptomyces sp. NPDC057565 TaxID=3346169 RepID=UPI003691F226